MSGLGRWYREVACFLYDVCEERTDADCRRGALVSTISVGTGWSVESAVRRKDRLPSDTTGARWFTAALTLLVDADDPATASRAAQESAHDHPDNEDSGGGDVPAGGGRADC